MSGFGSRYFETLYCDGIPFGVLSFENLAKSTRLP